jgi:hypothetical protein
MPHPENSNAVLQSALTMGKISSLFHEGQTLLSPSPLMQFLTFVIHFKLLSRLYESLVGKETVNESLKVIMLD